MAILADSRRFINVTTTKTITDAESGQVQNVTVDARTLTLPTVAAGKVVTVRIGGAAPAGAPAGTGTNKSVGLTITGSAIAGLGVASGTNVTLAKASSRVGDEVTFVGGAAIWYIQNVKGDFWALA